MLRYPIGQQSFHKLREDGFLYVDKTRLVYELVNDSHYVFLARPRRFGKSLLLSTIKAYFEGRKDLFHGLEIEKLEKEWKKHPVFLLELSRINNNSTDSINASLDQQFSVWEKDLNINNENPEFGSRFSTILLESFKKTGERAVVLVDEYDNPLINTLGQSDIHERNRTLLKSVYSNLKALDEYIRFGMLTGVSRFSKMSVFSGLNNLRDITFSNQFSAICGITREEIKSFIKHGVENLAKEVGKDFEETMEELAKWYDGYHFSEKCPDLYNPFSILNAMANREIKPYWFATGTPEFLVTRLNIEKDNFLKVFQDKALETSLASSDTSFKSPVPLLYQTGYLTIKDYDPSTCIYTLGIPNKEVEKALFPYLVSEFSDETQEDIVADSIHMKQCLENKDVEGFMEVFKSFLAGIPYDIIPVVNEKYFQNTLFLLFRTMPLEVDGERRTSDGRADLVVKTERYIYVIELKLDQSAEKALQQINEKGYALPYRNSGKEIVKIGISFSSETRNISSWQIEK